MKPKFFEYFGSPILSAIILLVCVAWSGCSFEPVRSYTQEKAGRQLIGTFPAAPVTQVETGTIPEGLDDTNQSKNNDFVEELEDLLEREDFDDIETWDSEFITVEDGGELELNDSEILIPSYAVSQDTLMIFYIPDSRYLEYWVYPGGLVFSDSVEIALSYEHAYLGGIDEEDISIVRWLPDAQYWEDLGGVVDTLHNVVRLKTLELNPPPVDTTYIRYALADHN